MSKTMTQYVWMVTYLRKNVTIVCGASYHLLWSWIFVKIRRSGSTSSQILHQEWAILANRNILESHVSRHNAMVYDTIAIAIAIAIVFVIPPLLTLPSSVKSHKDKGAARR